MNTKADTDLHSNGKLLLTGEYLVLLGAKALSVPLRLGQKLHAKPVNEKLLRWSSLEKGLEWFNAEYSLNELKIKATTDYKIAQVLQLLLQKAQLLNPDFLPAENGFSVTTNLEFNRNWGLGSSSTLVANIASWASCDPYLLNQLVFGGSGYDIACARSRSPLIYQLLKGFPAVEEVSFHPEFSSNLWFVWLNQKQNSREGIALFDRSKAYAVEQLAINKITEKICRTDNLKEFEVLIAEHEQILSSILKTETVQQLLFPDFPGTIKSLGAWGGDFILVASNYSSDEVVNYFNSNGFETIFKYDELVM